MNTSTYCYFNGDLLPYSDLHLHVSDLQIQRGYGIFDFFRTRKGSIPWLEDYTDRIFNSLKLSEIELAMDREQFKTIVFELQEKNKLENGAFKVLVTGGYSDSLDAVSGPPNLMILNLPWQAPPADSFSKGVNLIKKQFVRSEPEVKTLYYFNTLSLRKKLKSFKAIDVLFHTDLITEASRANLFFIKDGTILTPARDILKGITRKQLLSKHSEIELADIDSDRLYEFDEVFLTSTSRDITPVVSIEGKKIGKGIPGPVTREVQASFRDLIP
jgi:branched-subunit amino acid aminotransferase/4-amino-4-deoxychorismate lyase